MRFDIITIFPELIENFCQKGVASRSKAKINAIDLRNFSKNKYKGVDQKPYGGSDGMVFCPEVVKEALNSIARSKNSISIYLTPQGAKFTDGLARKFALLDQIIFVCGRYAGIDERVVRYVDLELSIGDYILSGGELASQVVMEAVIRFQKDVLSNSKSLDQDSFSKDGLLEAPVFTKPREFQNSKVPQVLLSGDHKKVNEFEKYISILRTVFRTSKKINPGELAKAKEFYQTLSNEEKLVCGLPINLDKFNQA